MAKGAIPWFVHYVFKKPPAAEASESVYMRERVNKQDAASLFIKKLFTHFIKPHRW